eukprot:scaffold3801_cov124-Isochrysis_galbana.AAC.5
MARRATPRTAEVRRGGKAGVRMCGCGGEDPRRRRPANCRAFSSFLSRRPLVHSRLLFEKPPTATRRLEYTRGHNALCLGLGLEARGCNRLPRTFSLSGCSCSVQCLAA